MSPYAININLKRKIVDSTPRSRPKVAFLLTLPWILFLALSCVNCDRRDSHVFIQKSDVRVALTSD